MGMFTEWRDDEIAKLQQQLQEARAEIERLALEIENQQYTITCASEENQQLKESLAEARAEIERLKEWEYCMKTQAPYEAAGATWELRHKHDQAVIAERDKLIEQMRDALNILVASATPSGPLWHGSAEMQIAKAALRAADGGE